MTHVAANPVHDKEARWEWSRNHDRCQICGILNWPRQVYRIGGMHTHHIIKPGRSDEPANLLRACSRCHDVIEGLRVPRDDAVGHFPPITLGMVLYAKREMDPAEFDLARLCVLWRNRELGVDGCNPFPELEPLPVIYLEERRKWSGYR